MQARRRHRRDCLTATEESHDVNPHDADPADVFSTMLHAIDNLNWEAFRASFTPMVALDYTSLWGGEPETVSIDDLTRSWQQLAHGFDATQHLTGPIVVTRIDERVARGRATVRAYHLVVDEDQGAAIWTVAGQYSVEFAPRGEGWPIAAIRLDVAYEEGDRGLVDVARQRSAAGIGGRTRSKEASTEEVG
jgi:SnoaL-like domain